MRKTSFVNNGIYHIYNRGIDKRAIIMDRDDAKRFFQSMVEFNTINPIGSIFQNSFRKQKKKLGGLASKEDFEEGKKLVDIICYCVNVNHFHFILRQVETRGIEKFMQRLGTGYTMYFNERYERSGSLFQGTFKSIFVGTNEYLLRLSAYVNLNFRVHGYDKDAMLLIHSSWDEYIGKSKEKYCEKDDVLGQFRKKEDYVDFAKDALVGILERKQLAKDLLME